MKRAVFLGPTLAADEALSRGIDVLPPAAQGDVLRALSAGYERIGIVDGYFDQVPSVTHKEILFAIERGAEVFGASSMGALRAAELWPFGMIGVGRIFAMYRDGVLENDDEVAVTHGPAESGYRVMAEALVNVRDRVAAAVASGVAGEAAGAALIAELQAMPYRSRTLRRIFERAEVIDPALAEFLKQPHPTLKAQDAEALLDRMTEREATSAPAVRVERTVFFERLRLEIAREAAADGELPDEARQAALLGILAGEHAELLAAPPPAEEIDALLEGFRAAEKLETDAALAGWLAERDLTFEELKAALYERAAIDRMGRLYAPEIMQRLRRRIPL